MSKIAWSLAFLSLVLSACAGSAPPRLTPIGDVIPAGVSLEGRWQLRAGTDSADARIRNAEYRSGGGRRGADGPSVYVFLRTGARLKITQTPYALFVSFDRSVVEEYRFREHRFVELLGSDDGGYELGLLQSIVLDLYGSRQLAECVKA